MSLRLRMSVLNGCRDSLNRFLFGRWEVGLMLVKTEHIVTLITARRSTDDSIILQSTGMHQLNHDVSEPCRC
jgi:hypothetical protein